MRRDRWRGAFVFDFGEGLGLRKDIGHH
jgi:hypothetical protein